MTPAAESTTEGLDMARGLDENLTRLLSTEPLLSAAASDEPLPEELVANLVGLGWHGLGVPEELGGLGLGPGDRARLAAVGGRHLAPAWLREETHALAPLLATLAPNDAQAATLLERLLSGELRGGGALVVTDSAPGAAPAYGFVAPRAEAVAVLGPDWAALAEPGGTNVQPLHGLDAGQGLCRVSLGVMRLVRGPEAIELRRNYVLAAASEALGAAERVLDDSVAYARERRQFGRPIASFQAVSSLLARMKLDVEVSRAGISGLVGRVDADRALETAYASVAHAVPAAARDVCEDGIQVHGGIGFSWELGLHLYYRRVLAIQYMLGGEAASASAVGALYLESRRT